MIAALEQDDTVELHLDDAFAELGLTPDATEPQVKAAWRLLVSQWHPDRNGSAAAVARMQRINRAVEAIRDAGFSRHAPSAPAAPPQRPSAAPATETPARTVHRKVKLTLEEAAFGCVKALRGKLSADCAACGGAGYRVLGGHCPACHGSGAVRQRSWFGWVGAAAECAACHGGGIARQPCEACAGSGHAASQAYQVSVRFPPGVRSGDLLGVAVRPGPAGSATIELSLRVEVRDHALFQLDADGTLRCTVPVDGFAWAANRPVEVPTLGGLQTIQPKAQQLGHRLPGQGFPVARGGARGDQLITITPVFPDRLNTDQSILLDQLIATTSGPAARQVDERLRAWNKALRGWKAGAPTA